MDGRSSSSFDVEDLANAAVQRRQRAATEEEARKRHDEGVGRGGRISFRGPPGALPVEKAAMPTFDGIASYHSVAAFSPRHNDDDTAAAAAAAPTRTGTSAQPQGGVMEMSGLVDRRASAAGGSAAKDSSTAPTTPQSSTAQRARSNSQLASSRWRVFGVVQRPTPEWRRKPGMAGSGTRRPSSTDAAPPVTPPPLETADVDRDQDRSAASLTPPLSPDTGGGMLGRPPTPSAGRRQSMFATAEASASSASPDHYRAAPTPTSSRSTLLNHNESSFNLAQNYRGKVVSKRNVRAMSGEAGRLSRVARESSAVAMSSRAGSKATLADSAGAANRSGAAIGAIALTETELEHLVQQRAAKLELGILEKYERQLVEAKEAEAAAVVARNIAVHERDAARGLVAKKNQRISELQEVVERLAARFLFKPRDGAGGGGGCDDDELAAASRVPIDVADRRTGRVLHPDTIERNEPLDLHTEGNADRKLYMRLQDAIRSFERR